MEQTRVAILISGAGSNMVALVQSMMDPDHPAHPALVLSNRADAAGLTKAAELGVATQVIDHRGRERADFDADIQAALEAADIDIVCLAGFLRIFTPEFVQRWTGRMLNIHPSLLPLFKGLHTHQQALDAGVAVHGCTAHEVIPELDAGPILGQAVMPVRPADTAESLAQRIRPLEHRLYADVLRRYADGNREKMAFWHD